MCLAIPGKIESINNTGVDSFRTGKVSFGGIIREVNLSMVPEAVVNDYVLVHVGVAINRIDEKEAMLTFSYLQQIGETNELEEP
jgi:hydrogenase expression/formation protein HypC